MDSTEYAQRLDLLQRAANLELSADRLLELAKIIENDDWPRAREAVALAACTRVEAFRLRERERKLKIYREAPQ